MDAERDAEEKPQHAGLSQSAPVIRNRIVYSEVQLEEEIEEPSVEEEQSQSYLEEEFPFDQSTSEKSEEKKIQPTFRQLLREKGLSTELVRILVRVGVTDEFARLLIALGIDEEDVKLLQELWRIEFGYDSSASIDSFSDRYLSPDGIYLKNAISKPLIAALKEIVQKRPFDPVEYLGHRLLYYKLCEERQRRQRELELELLLEREKLKMQGGGEEEAAASGSVERGEEEFLEDWDYINYEPFL